MAKEKKSHLQPLYLGDEELFSLSEEELLLFMDMWVAYINRTYGVEKKMIHMFGTAVMAYMIKYEPDQQPEKVENKK